MSDEQYFTIVFKGDIRKLDFNPLKTTTIYGEPVAASVGNALDKIEAFEGTREWDAQTPQGQWTKARAEFEGTMQQARAKNPGGLWSMPEGDVRKQAT